MTRSEVQATQWPYMAMLGLCNRPLNGPKVHGHVAKRLMWPMCLHIRPIAVYGPCAIRPRSGV